MSGWRGSTRRARLPANWDSELVPLIYSRDGAQCTYVEHGDRCPKRGHQDKKGHWRGLEVDHVKRGDDHHPSNLRLLCSMHHSTKSSQEGAAALQKKRERINQKYRRTTPHPGSW